MYREAAKYIQEKIGRRPKVGLILGTGLGETADLIQDPTALPYAEIPHFPISTAPGHSGRLICGSMEGRTVLCMQGRFHFYEGYTMQQLALPIRTMRALGVETLVITCATGAINPTFRPGDIVLIQDHIKLALDSPVRGKNADELGERFFDMTAAYTPRLQAVAERAAETAGVPLHKGVYAYMGGPQFETPAEIKMLRHLGADLVGMSTVPEVICAAHCGMEVLALSCVTNMAAGMEDGGFNTDVIQNAEREGVYRMESILRQAVKLL